MATTGIRRRMAVALAAVLALLLVVLAGAVIFISTYDWNRARGWIGDRASAAAGRQVVIDGDLSIDWSRPGEDGVGLARWVPLPRIVARGVSVGNPEWLAGHLANTDDLHFVLQLLPLLEHRLVFDEIALGGLDAQLVREQGGRNNWTLERPQQAPAGRPWQVSVRRLMLREGRLALDDAPHKLKVELSFSTIDPPTPEGYAVALNAKGSFRGAPITGKGRVGPVLTLGDETHPFPLEADLRVGSTHVRAQGTLTDPARPVAVDLKLDISASSMANLYPLTGLTLPDTPPFHTAGRVVGRMEGKEGSYAYRDFTGTVGGSDLAGTLEYRIHEPRPRLSGRVVSHTLRFSDLGPLIGAKSGGAKPEAEAAEEAPRGRAGKVLPTQRFRTERWTSMDADVEFAGERILRDKALPINALKTHAVLQDGLLTLQPLDFSVAGGALKSDVRLDGRQAPLRAQLQGSIDALQLKQLFPTLESMRASLGQLNGSLALSGSGATVADMLASANGEVRTVINRGSFSKYVLEAAGLNIGSVVLTRLFGDRQVQLNCLIGDFAVRNGVMRVQNFLLDTEDAFVTMEGSIDLGQEKLDLTLRPEQKSARLLSLRSPLYVSGNFAKPDVGVDKAMLALRLGGSVALGVAAPAAALLPLVQAPAGEQADDCAHAVQRLRERGKQPLTASTRRGAADAR